MCVPVFCFSLGLWGRQGSRYFKHPGSGSLSGRAVPSGPRRARLGARATPHSVGQASGLPCRTRGERSPGARSRVILSGLRTWRLEGPGSDLSGSVPPCYSWADLRVQRLRNTAGARHGRDYRGVSFGAVRRRTPRTRGEARRADVRPSREGPPPRPSSRPANGEPALHGPAEGGPHRSPTTGAVVLALCPPGFLVRPGVLAAAAQGARPEPRTRRAPSPPTAGSGEEDRGTPRLVARGFTVRLDSSPRTLRLSSPAPGAPLRRLLTPLPETVELRFVCFRCGGRTTTERLSAPRAPPPFLVPGDPRPKAGAGCGGRGQTLSRRTLRD